MSINDIHDVIEHQDVWASWRDAAKDDIKAEAERDKATAGSVAKAQKVFG